MKDLDLELNDEFHKNLFPNKLSAAIIYRNLSNAKLGSLIKKSSSTVFNWRNKNGYYTVADCANIAEALELEIQYFFDPEMSAQEADRKLNKKQTDEKKNLLKDILFEDKKYGIQKKIADYVVSASDNDLKKLLTFIEMIT